MDSIPDVQITGKEQAEGLYWVKLPVNDKRALILGDITSCCQSIGRHSEQCVKDAVTLTDNGLYVLLKKRRKDAHAVITGREINDHDFKIVGQSYVWKSMNGNLCLDSIESLSDEVSTDSLRSILSSFASKLLQDNPDIKCITLGAGGKTPEHLFSRTFITEKIRYGYQYSDSFCQYCIAKTPFDNLDIEQRTKLDNLLDPYPKYIKDVINYSSFYAENTAFFVEQLENISAFIELLRSLGTTFPELEDHLLNETVLNELLECNDLIVAIQNTPIDKRTETKENMLSDACNNNDTDRVNLLRWLDFPITERLIKNIDPRWATQFMPQIEPILERLQYVDHVDSLYYINREKLSELVLASFIEEANSESHDIVDDNKLTLFIRNKLHEINEQENTRIIRGTTQFKTKFLELKENYDRSKDFSGPSIYEID